jgi:hypothetical protein
VPPLIVLPPLSIPTGTATREACKVSIVLRDLEEIPQIAGTSARGEYYAGLQALAQDDPLDALKHLRKVVEQDEALEHGSAAVLACLLSLQLDDVESFRALRSMYLGNDRPDDYAAHLVSTSRLSIPTPDGDDALSVVLTECLQMPAIAVQLATVGSLMQEERLSEAAELLENIAIHVPEPQLVTSTAQQVQFGHLLASVRAPLCFPVGVDADGEPHVCDLVKASHLLVAGSNGAEKTSFLHSIICSLLMAITPDDLLMMMVDTKQVELTVYDGIPHLLCPVVTDAYEAVDHFSALVDTMEKSYRIIQEAGARNIKEFNEKVSYNEKLPYILVIVDEMADLVAINRKTFQKVIISITQRAQAVGIYLVLATQFPRGDVCTNSIKHSLPSRIAFLTTSRAESRIIIDSTGAQDLFGGGDCLYAHENRAPVWVQSGYVTSADVAAVVDHWKGKLNRHNGDADGNMWQSPNPAIAHQARISRIPEALCSLYSRSGRSDDVLAVTTRYPAARLDIWRAAALAQKGLSDAALLVYDDFIQRLQSPTLIARTRYAKTKLLMDMGNAMAARRELAQVYAVMPDFQDDAGLLTKLKTKQQTPSRSPIPEAVRHAVWRRDEGRCVQCGSQESLEFDHVIPVSRGGANTERNLQLLCERCNREKSATI